MKLHDLANAMYKEVETKAKTERKLSRGLVLILATDDRRDTYKLTLQRAHVLPSAQEIAICRAAFQVPKEAAEAQYVDHVNITWKK